MVLEDALSVASQDEAVRRVVWNRCREVPGLKFERWRCDHADRLMKWEEHGNRASKVGWALAYVKALSEDGADHHDNLHAVAFGEIRTSPTDAG